MKHTCRSTACIQREIAYGFHCCALLYQPIGSDCIAEFVLHSMMLLISDHWMCLKIDDWTELGGAIQFSL